MIIDHERRFAFVHIQKTGGLTVGDYLLKASPTAGEVHGVRGGRHPLLKHALRECPEIRPYWIFGFVRNPWARMYSWHSMVLRRWATAAEPGKEAYAEVVTRNAFWVGVNERYREFESFVMEAPNEFERLRQPQVGYLRARGRRADFVGRTERLVDDLAHVCRHLDLPVPEELPRQNAGTSSDHRPHYTAAMIDRVADLFADDIEAFGYAFDR